MKKRNKSYHRRKVRNIKLFMNDLIELIELFKKKKLNYFIRDEDYEYENIQDLIDQKGNTTKIIEFEVRNPDETFGFMSIKIEKNYAEFGAGVDEKLKNFVLEIEDFFIQRKRHWIFNFLNIFGGAAITSFGLIILIAALLGNFYKNQENDLIIWLILILFGLIIIIISLLIPQSNRNIELKKEHEVNYLKLNKERIAINVLMLILGSIITLIIESVIEN